MGKEYITIDRPITPYFRCTDIAKIGPKYKMFLQFKSQERWERLLLIKTEIGEQRLEKKGA